MQIQWKRLLVIFKYYFQKKRRVCTWLCVLFELVLTVIFWHGWFDSAMGLLSLNVAQTNLNDIFLRKWTFLILIVAFLLSWPHQPELTHETSSDIVPFSYLLVASPNGRLYQLKLEERILPHVPGLIQNKLLPIFL